MNHDCVKNLPDAFNNKFIGHSWYTFESFEDDQCGEIKTKKEQVPFIQVKY